MNLKSLLENTSSAEFKPAARLPAGTYKVQIVKYDWLPFSWKKSNSHGLMYVPTIKLIDYIPSGDDDTDAEFKAQLDAYGDWTARELQFAYSPKDTPNKRMAQVAEINFPLVETDAAGEPIGIMERQAARFHVTADKNGGVEAGWIHDVLGLSFPNGASLGDLAEATVDLMFICALEYEPNQDETRPPNLVIGRNSMAPA